MATVRKAEKLLAQETIGQRVRRWLRGERCEPLPHLPGDLLEDPEPGKIGICCSGGGVRSAVYNLGVLQALEQEPADNDHSDAPSLLRSARYLSAVSGGSYIASSYAMIARNSDPKLLADDPPLARGSPEEQHLRTHSTYLVPGMGGAVGLIRQLLLGMAMNLFLIGAALYVLANPLGWAYAEWLQPGLGDGAVDVDPWMWLVVAAFAVPGAIASLASFVVRIRSERTRRLLRVWGDRLLMASLVPFALLIGIPLIIQFVHKVMAEGLADLLGVDWLATAQGSGVLAVLSALGITGMMAGAAKALVSRHAATIALAIAAVAGPVGLASVFLLFVNNAAAAGFASGDWLGPTIVLSALVLLYVIGDPMQWSMHPFYRRRLCSAFALRRVRDPKTGGIDCEELDYERPVRLSKSQPPDFPELVVCAAANTSETGVTPCGRNATSFTFSARKVGGPLIGYVETKDLEWAAGNQGHRLTLPAAVAMSGAAISPSMGKQTRRSLTFLLAVANVRLGVWVPNPRWHERLAFERAAERPARHGLSQRLRLGTIEVARRGRRNLEFRPRLWNLAKELLGWNRLDDRYLYVTDGGHYENLGLVELLRRGCTEIYAFDASGDDVDSFATLGEAVALARSDLLVEIDIDPSPMRQDPDTRRSGVDHVVGTFRYRDGTEGRIVFAKTAVVAGAPWDVLAFADSDERFPNHSTLEQLFDDEQFEAYRALGYDTARRAAAAMRGAHDEAAPGERARRRLRDLGLVFPERMRALAARVNGGRKTREPVVETSEPPDVARHVPVPPPAAVEGLGTVRIPEAVGPVQAARRSSTG